MAGSPAATGTVDGVRVGRVVGVDVELGVGHRLAVREQRRRDRTQLSLEPAQHIADDVADHIGRGRIGDAPDLAAFSRNYTSVSVIGERGLLRSDKVAAGFSLQRRDTYYPPHAHHAEESYWIIGGDGDWRVGTEPWFAVEPGDSIYHESGARHAMQTNEQPLLAVWLWTSHLDSKVVIVRG